MRIFMCGNTGVKNRGCEAIIRSTVDLFTDDVKPGQLYLATFAEEQDLPMARELGINLISYNRYPTVLHRYIYGAMRKVFKRSLMGLSVIQKPLFERISSHDVSLNIGGDTYCYNRPINALTLNRYTHRKGIKNILWCCSIEKDSINSEIKKDLNRYAYIFAREEMTVNNLLQAGIKKEKIVQVCDPAFFLKTKETSLPDGFEEGNTVGINLSQMVINDKNPQVYENILHTAKYILDTLKMSICLIPHVYSIYENTNDYPILKKLYKDLDHPSVSIVDKELTCEELKYIISKCSYFIGARTHSTIAAYSSKIPTLVLGYSVKSKGIATDLFGTYENFVLPYTDLTEKMELKVAFDYLIENEQWIQERYESFLTKYKDRLIKAINSYIIKGKNEKKKSVEVCSKDICTGCAACKEKCPKSCIYMMKDEEGFLYPQIDTNICVNCGLCQRVCPALNKPKDEIYKELPSAYAVVNKNENIRMKSSSGGVFSLLAKEVLKNNGVVFGTAFDETFQVITKCIEAERDIEEIYGSKYVQGSTNESYILAERFLEKGTMVLYTGTPCQIAGLKSFLKKEYDNLYTQDIICHGVPSPLVWDKYLKWRKKEADSDIKRVSFRDKRLGWQRYSILFEFVNRTRYVNVLNYDPYMQGYLGHLFLRPACGSCSFKQLQRQSDITLGDFWGIDTLLPTMSDNKGTSLVCVHSNKGYKLLEKIKEDAVIQEVDFARAVEHNRSYLRSSIHSPFRSKFLKEIVKYPDDFEKRINKYLGKSLNARIRRILSRFFPNLYKLDKTWNNANLSIRR